MTSRRIIGLCNSVLSIRADLSCMVGKLEKAASEILGYDVAVCLCIGNEIEFHKVDDDGVPNPDSYILLEDIVKLSKKGGKL